MRTITAFNHISVDGYFCDANGDMSWAHGSNDDPEWNEFVSGNASGGGALLFGRVTYQQMAGFWPTPLAQQSMPTVAAAMNRMHKFVFSKTLDKAEWENTTLLKSDLPSTVRKLKAATGPDLAIMGSGTIVAQLAAAGLIDTYQFIVNPRVLGSGKTLFAGVTQPIALTLTSSRTFKNGNTLLTYAPRDA